MFTKAYCCAQRGVSHEYSGLSQGDARPAWAKRVYVEAVAAGLRAKQACEDTVERARAEMDDIVAEAAYLNETVYGVEDEEDSASDTAAETVPAKA